jgi:hypothetical protein
MDSADFLTAVHDHIKACTSDGDLGLPGYIWKLDDADALAVFALDLQPTEAWALFMVEALKPETRQILFCLDRYSRPQQGTSLSDLVAGIYFDRPGQRLRPFIVEYQAKPEHRVLWFNWQNEFWNAAIRHELKQVLARQPGLAGGKDRVS